MDLCTHPRKSGKSEMFSSEGSLVHPRFPETMHAPQSLTFFGNCRTISAVLPALNVPVPPGGVGVLLRVRALGQLSEDLVVCRGIHEPDTGGKLEWLNGSHDNILGKLECWSVVRLIGSTIFREKSRPAQTASKKTAIFAQKVWHLQAGNSNHQIWDLRYGHWQKWA